MELKKLIEETDALENFLTEERIEKINRVLENRTDHLTVVLEDIYHSHNASAVIRTCDCFGIQNMHVIENEKLNRVNKCVAQGAGKWITLNKYKRSQNNTAECIKALKTEGYSIVATALVDGPVAELEELPVENEKIALCFGCEEFGLSEQLINSADHVVKLPMHGFTQSFNISVTVALCLQVLVKKLRMSDINWQLKHDDFVTLKHKWVKSSVKNADKILQRLGLF